MIVLWDNFAIAINASSIGSTGFDGVIGDFNLDADFVSGRIGEWDVVLAIAVGGWSSIGPGAGDDLGVVWASGSGAGGFG